MYPLKHKIVCVPGRKNENALSKFFSSTSASTLLDWALICLYALSTTIRNLSARCVSWVPCKMYRELA